MLFCRVVKWCTSKSINDFTANYIDPSLNFIFQTSENFYSYLIRKTYFGPHWKVDLPICISKQWKLTFLSLLHQWTKILKHSLFLSFDHSMNISLNSSKFFLNKFLSLLSFSSSVLFFCQNLLKLILLVFYDVFSSSCSCWNDCSFSLFSLHLELFLFLDMVLFDCFEVWMQVFNRNFRNSKDFILYVFHKLLLVDHCLGHFFILEWLLLLRIWILVFNEMIVCVNMLTSVLRFLEIIWLSRGIENFRLSFFV